MDPIQFVTDCGDSAVILPLIILVGLWLALAPGRQGLAVWVLACLGTIGMIGGLKLLFGLCGHHLLIGRANPSGHMALSTMFYGGLAVIAARRLDLGRRRWPLAAGVALLLGAMGYSRIALGAHTPGEVAGGLIVGLAGLLWFIRHYRAPQHPAIRFRFVAAAILVLLVALHGEHAAAEELLENIIGFVWSSSGVCASPET